MTADEFGVTLNTDGMARELADYWSAPTPFPETEEFLRRLPVPSLIVSNIDNKNIDKALKFTRHPFQAVITSEDARCYKPRVEIFNAALQIGGYQPQEVLLMGDSLSLDVAGANHAGIDVVWMNRKGNP